MKRFLAMILVLIMAVSVFAACEKTPEDPAKSSSSSSQNNGQNNGDNNTPAPEVLSKLNGKTPKELFAAMTNSLKDLTDYEITITETSTVTFVGEPNVTEDTTEYVRDGNNAYVKYTDPAQKTSEMWLVDDMFYIFNEDGKQKTKMTFANFASDYLIDISKNIYPLADSYFEKLQFIKDVDKSTEEDSFYALSILIDKEEYAEYAKLNVADDVKYVLCFDSKGQIASIALRADVNASNSVSMRFDTLIDFEKIGEVDTVKLPEDADAYRKAPALDEIDMSPIESLEGVTVSTEATDYVMLDMGTHGKIVVRLYSDVAPETVANFKKLVGKGFYDGLIMHRVDEDFVIQGGDIDGDGAPNSGDVTINGEFASNGFINNLSHLRGVISMARMPDDPDSASTQFFIMHKDTDIDGDYAAFGCVVYGIEAVDSIAKVEVENKTDRPLTPVVITSAKFVKVK